MMLFYSIRFSSSLELARGVSREPVAVGVLGTQATRTPIVFRFSSNPERREGCIEKTIILLLNYFLSIANFNKDLISVTTCIKVKVFSFLSFF